MKNTLLRYCSQGVNMRFSFVIINKMSYKLSSSFTVASTDTGCLSRMQPDHPDVCQHDYQQQHSRKGHFHFIFTSCFPSARDLGLRKCTTNYCALPGACVWRLTHFVPASSWRAGIRVWFTGEDLSAKDPAANTWSSGEFNLLDSRKTVNTVAFTQSFHIKHCVCVCL